ncbi:MAG: cadherin-like domain-containing protein [Burkholderiales bacterium]|nr:cadherin-like domain-containing protein [Burkholderiales bacterium]
MNTKKSVGGAALLAAVTALLAPAQTQAAEFYLRAESLTIADPNGGTPIAMWGYALCTGSGTGCGAPSVPGPALTVPAGDNEITVHLLNNLPKPTSLIINGLIKPMTPVWDSGVAGNRPSATARVRSFDAEAASNGTADYTWTNVKPGTYLYQSGTQPQVQVQMGLYGAVAKNAADASLSTSAQAYSGVAYDNQAVLLYSEIDPVLHAAVADGSYGTAPGPTSTFNYEPKYFLINGQPYPSSSSVIAPAGNTGTTLLRFLNAGLTTHVPMIQGAHWDVVAEDGKPYPFRGRQYTALLPAAKTMDVLLTPDAGGAVYPIVDRRLNLSNNGLADGGMLAYLQYGAAGVSGAAGTADGNLAPIAVADTYNSVRGVQLSVGAAAGVLANDNNTDGLPQPIRAVAASGSTLQSGTYTLNANGSFVYTPAAGFVGADSFDYLTTDGKALSNIATVTINLDEPFVPALALLDNFDRADSTSLGGAWSQVASTTSPPNVEIAGNQAIAAATNLGGLAIFNALQPETQGASFNAVSVLPNSALVLKATGGTLASPANYVRVRCEVANGGEVVVATMMGGSNVSVFVRQGAFPATACNASGSLSAVVDAKGLVTVFLNGLFVGGVQLPDVGAWKGPGKIGIQLQTLGAMVDNFSGGPVSP